jgi:uncharacterized membrane protein YjjP (DUF1212 family)
MERQLSGAELIEYLVDLGGALLSHGCPTHRVETLLAEIAAQEGFRADAFGVPTGLFLSLSGPDRGPRSALPSGGRSEAEPPGSPQPLVRMVRVVDWATDLGRLTSIDRLFNDVLARRVSLADARRALDDIEGRPPIYGRALRLAAGAVVAGAAAVFFRGTLLEVAIAALGGLVVGLMRVALGGPGRALLLGDFLGAAIAAGAAWGAKALFPGVAREVIVLSVVILLVPGMALTTGLAELVHKNLVSGAAKLMEALVVFMSIVFGIAAMVALEQLVGAQTATAPSHGEPGLLLNAAALLVTSAGFCVLFYVPPRLAPGAMLSGAVAWIVTALGVRHLPGSLSAFVAALAIATLANGLARLSQRPAQVFLLPGLALLVPGSFGFLSLESFLAGDFLHGAARGFDMFLTAGAIVTGLLVANVILPARKLL